MNHWPDILEALAIALFAGDLVVRGHASDVAGIVVVLAIRLARALWPKPSEAFTTSMFTSEEIRNLRSDVAQLKNDVSRVSLVVGVSKG